LWHGHVEQGFNTLIILDLPKKWDDFTDSLFESDATDGILNVFPENTELGPGQYLPYWTLDEKAVEKLEDLLMTNDYEMIFWHLEEMDATGHTNSFSPLDPPYLNAMENTDRLVKRALEAINSRPNRENEEWLIAMTTDHGGGNGDYNGKDKGHGELNEYCRTIWLII